MNWVNDEGWFSCQSNELLGDVYFFYGRIYYSLKRHGKFLLAGVVRKDAQNPVDEAKSIIESRMNHESV